MSKSKEEILALIQLLDDPSDEVNRTVTKNLLDRGLEILPDLEAAWEGSMDQGYQEKLVNLIQEIQVIQATQEIRRPTRATRPTRANYLVQKSRVLRGRVRRRSR